MRRRVTINDAGRLRLLPERAGRAQRRAFEPQLTPKQMLRLGGFGGQYMTDCRGEFPASWFAQAKLCPERSDPRLN